tara:strand:- start:602 stop:1246 length:645 start_codon:yes stop_codon:yes gene_type:complete
MSTRELYVGPVSPYGRAVRIVLAEKGLEYEHGGVFPGYDMSPTNQVPALIEDGQVIWDSGAIIEYLMSRYPNIPPVSGHVPFADTLVRPDHELSDKLTLTTLLTLGTCLTNLFQFRDAFPSYEDHPYLGRCIERAGNIIAWCETQLDSETNGFFPGSVSVADVRLASFLAFVESGYVEFDWRSYAGPKMSSMVARLEARPSFVEFPIPLKEPAA